MRQADCAGVEVDESHGDALPCQGRELVEGRSAELDSFDEVGWFGTAEAVGEVLRVEHGDLLLQEANGCGRARVISMKDFALDST